MRRSTPTAKLELPEKWKGGRTERFVNFWRNLFRDYAEACQDIGTACRARPLKAGIYGSAAAFALYANHNNPDLRSFYEQHVVNHQELTLISTANRNPAAFEWQCEVNRAANQGLLRSWNLGLFTVVWRADYAPEVGHVKAKCKYLEPSYTDVALDFVSQGHRRVVDVGFLGRWWRTSKSMKEYDINPDEWDEHGRPTQSQLKQMW